jgi:sorbitol-specific phosphotransferase system component IIC
VARTLLVVLPLLSGLAFALGAWGDAATTEMLLYIAVVRGVTGLGLTAAAVALWWHLTVRRPDRSTPSGALRDTGV